MITITILAIDQASKNTAYSVAINGKLDSYGMITASGERDERIYQMALLIRNKIDAIKPDIIYFENIQLQKGNVSTYQLLARLQGELIFMLRQMNMPYEIVAPSKWKSHLEINKCKRDWQKKACVEMMEKKYDLDLFGNDDIADSLGILTYAIDKNEQ